ncbi:hypothetical protein AQ794_04600 [Burkholderia pseudomallei]|nr:hypothetical protein AQ791_10495 [Burkholderia pseudomallei]OMV41385.1 hypothetical protein AQ792_05920 [Burkholderia pseudomallei]OMV55582.1 hypothetical protein AQ793_04085 [Burkholderia pseudomallei]OMV56623.1 hypothetical protein AQ794_04600 [Burkholderia pseudomallei]OMV67017.1 hypothetical protein AQ796_14750 [Burkholderia pseudomallei]
MVFDVASAESASALTLAVGLIRTFDGDMSAHVQSSPITRGALGIHVFARFVRWCKGDLNEKRRVHHPSSSVVRVAYLEEEKFSQSDVFYRW